MIALYFPFHMTPDSSKRCSVERRLRMLKFQSLVTRREMARVLMATRLLKYPGIVPSLDVRIERTHASIRGTTNGRFLFQFQGLHSWNVIQSALSRIASTGIRPTSTWPHQCRQLITISNASLHKNIQINNKLNWRSRI